jgi:uncharacterized protein
LYIVTRMSWNGVLRRVPCSVGGNGTDCFVLAAKVKPDSPGANLYWCDNEAVLFTERPLFPERGPPLSAGNRETAPMEQTPVPQNALLEFHAPHSPHSLLRILLLGLIPALLAPSAPAQKDAVPPATRRNGVNAPSGGATAEMTSEEIFSRLSGRVLFLTCDLPANAGTQASGVLVSADGFVVTNAHVVEGCLNLTATYINGSSRRSYEAALKYYDKKSDTAVLKVEGQGFEFFSLLARNVRVGERVYAIGNPRGLEQSMSEGIVSGLRDNDGAVWIQHSAPISPGSSGGALISSRGDLLGINSWFLKESQGLNFAVPASALASAYRGARSLQGVLRFPGVPPVFQPQTSPTADAPLNPSLAAAPPPSERGDAEAQYKLGGAYLLGQGVLKDDAEAAKWFRKAADQGYAPAQSLLGLMLRDGQGVPQDDAQAAKWFRKAADQGYAQAQGMLGIMLHGGQGVPQDYAEAAKWFRRAADQGDADAQVMLGITLHDGRGVPQDYSEAVKWYRKSADQGEAVAQLNLGVALHDGQGVPQDYVEAAKWYRKAADQGSASAQYNLGDMLRDGQGMPQNYAEAAKWYRKAADQGYASAQLSLGTMLHNGQGVPQDYAEAATWFRKVAEQGNPLAQGKLALGYEKGEGVAQDYVLAHMWYNLAAARSTGEDQKRSSRMRDSLAAKMTPAQIAEAQRLAREWKPAAQK